MEPPTHSIAAQRRPAAAVTLSGVGKRYGTVTAVRDVSLRIAPGELVTLLGPSGCGKTTTLRMIAGLELPDDGTIRIGDKDVTKLPSTARNVGMVFQTYALFPHMTILDNVAYGLRARGVGRAEGDRRALAALAQVGLEGVEARFPSALSGGQQQRVALARALVPEPEVLLFDEPLSNLDARLRRRMREEIREIQQRLGITAVYVTHDQEEALSISDRIVVMDRAVVVQEGSPRALYEAPATRFVAGFMGDANLVPARLRRRPDGAPLADVEVGALTLALPHQGLPDGDVLLAVRPEAVRLERAGEGPGLAGRVGRATYVGRHMEYTLATDVGPLFVACPRVDAPLAAGADVRVVLEPGAGVTLVAAERKE